MDIIFVLLFWLGWSVVNYAVALDKNRNAGRIFALSLLLSPLLIYLYLLAVPDRKIQDYLWTLARNSSQTPSSPTGTQSTASPQIQRLPPQRSSAFSTPKGKWD